MHETQQDNVLGFGGLPDDQLMFLCYCEVTVIAVTVGRKPRTIRPQTPWKARTEYG